MRTPKRLLALSIAVAVLAAPSAASAQVPWDSPSFLSPSEPPGLGVHWVNYGTFNQDGSGIMGSWRAGPFPNQIRVRGGFAEGAEGEDAIFGGFDVSRALATDAGFPVALSWNLGAGASAGEWMLLSVPMGVSAGRSLESGDVRFEPYVAPRVVLDGRFGDEAPGDEFDLALVLEIGATLAFDARGRFVLRGAAALGDRHAVALGFVVGPGR